MAQQIVLDVYYDLSVKELRIKFYTAQQAQKYQERNREGRILANDSRSVWIPMPDEVILMRASTLGFILRFRTTGAALLWCERVILGTLYRYPADYSPLRPAPGNEAYIIREWAEDDLNRKLTGVRGSPGLQLPDRIPDGHRGPSPGRAAKIGRRGEGGGEGVAIRGFGITPEMGSREAGS